VALSSLSSILGRGLFALAAMLAALFAPSAYVGAQDLPFYDEHVLGALGLLDANPATSDLRGVVDRNRVFVRFVPMAASTFARYSVARHVIEIDTRWIDVDDTTLAAVLAHEATHARDAVSGYLSSGGETACLDSEVAAFRTSALFWLDQYGRGGKPSPQNELERQLNAIAERQSGDPHALEDLVRQTYVQQCTQ
jgi:hypothetical protein